MQINRHQAQRLIESLTDFLNTGFNDISINLVKGNSVEVAPMATGTILVETGSSHFDVRHRINRQGKISTAVPGER